MKRPIELADNTWLQEFELPAFGELVPNTEVGMVWDDALLCDRSGRMLFYYDGEPLIWVHTLPSGQKALVFVIDWSYKYQKDRALKVYDEWHTRYTVYVLPDFDTTLAACKSGLMYVCEALAKSTATYLVTRSSLKDGSHQEARRITWDTLPDMYKPQPDATLNFN